MSKRFYVEPAYLGYWVVDSELLDSETNCAAGWAWTEAEAQKFADELNDQKKGENDE